jgi:hypothetical protein
MQVEHRLTGARPHVEHRPISLLDPALPRDLGRGQMAAAKDLRISFLGFFQSCKVPLRNDKHMRRRLGLDVFKGEDVFILINFFRWNLAANDAAKKAVGIGHGGSPAGTITPLALLVSPRQLGKSAVLCRQICERLRAHIPGAFKRIVQIGEDEVGKEQQH